MGDVARIDKWLWAARIFKTRSIAADACKNGRVTIKGVNVKPSHTVKAGETVCVRKPPVTYSFKILKTIEQRVGAKLLPEIYENVSRLSMRSMISLSTSPTLRPSAAYLFSLNSVSLEIQLVTFRSVMKPMTICLIRSW